jgi:hypothetical protein
MAAHRLPPLTSLPTPALRALLATERDPHRRQRELVRASLVSCPAGSGRRGRPRKSA